MYHLPAGSILFTAALHVLQNILRISKEQIKADAEYFGVTVNGTVYKGLSPLVRVLRSNASTDTDRLFLGAGLPFEQVSAMHQWVEAAAWLSVDADASRVNNAYVSQAKILYGRVEQMIELQQLSQSFVAQTTVPTVADILLYAALHQHPLHKDVLPTTRKWSVHVQKNDAFAPIRAAHLTSEKSSTEGPGAGAGSKAPKPVYVKPTEEDIQRRRLEKEKAKKEKEAQKAAAASAAGGAAPANHTGSPAADGATSSKKPLKGATSSAAVSINDLVDIRVGRLTNIRRHPEADRLYVEDMDIGTEVRTVVSGLVEHYTVEELTDSLCFVFCNMKPKPLKGVVSQGMVMCANSETKVVLARPPAGAKPGDRVVFGDSYNVVSDPATRPFPAALSGNKMTELLQYFHTNENGDICWKDQKAWLAQGVATVPGMNNCVVK